jgi:benzodiazapine receptor
MNKDTVRQIAVVVSVVVTIVVNILANALLFNGTGTGVISDSFEVFFVPAGYVFSIWGLIYIGLIAFAVFQALPSQRENPRLRRIGNIFLLSSVANIAWLFFWHYFWNKALFPLTLVDMLVLLGTLIAIYLRLGTGRSEAPLGERLAVRLPFSIYLGWITVATIANVTDLFYHWGWRPAAGPAQVWAVVVLGAAVAIAALMSYFRADVAYLAVLVWAFVGIALNPLPRFDGATIVTTGAWVAAGLVAVLAVAGPVLRRRPAQK